MKSMRSWLATAVVCGMAGMSYGQVALQYFGANGPLGAPLTVATNTVINITATMRPAGATWLRLSTLSPTLPSAIIGPVVVSDVQRLDVVVAGSSVEAIPAATSDDIQPGAYEFKGITFTNQNSRLASRFGAWLAFDRAGAIASNVSGDVDVGSVVRIQADRITGDVRAGSVAQIRLSSLLSGNVTIENAGSLGVINVSRDDGDPNIDIDIDAIGITGDVVAPGGTIGEISTDGQIGGSRRPLFQARRILKINAASLYPTERTELVGADASIVPRLLDATIQVTSPLLFAVDRIESTGDITGAIQIENFQHDFGGGPERLGIYAHGGIHAPIAIARKLFYADIVGATIAAPVSVGIAVKGSIVANGLTGRIENLSIGRGIFPPSEVGGMIGAFNPPVPENTNSVWYFGTRTLGSGPVPNDTGTIDSVIRAHTIGTVDVKNMLFNLLGKNYSPRIEATTIDFLKIDNLQDGVVWSGLLEYDPNAPAIVANDPTNDFASIAVAEIGCVGAAGHIWFEDTPLFIVENNMTGHLHAKRLTSEQTVRIGKRLDSRTDPTGCDCVVVDVADCQAQDPRDPGQILESSPRRIVAERHGTISMFEDLTLAGQIIINANDLRDANGQQLSPQELFTGQVIVPDSVNGDRVFAVPSVDGPVPTPDFVMPSYTTFPSTFGGGAVGLVPFGVHWTYSDSLNTGLLNSGLSTPFTCNQHVQMDFYGPITNVNNDPTRSIKLSFDGSTNLAGFINMSVAGTGNRTLQFRAKTPYLLPLGTFVVTRNLLTSTGQPNTNLIRCDVPLLPATAEFNDDDGVPGYDYVVNLDCPATVGGPFDCTLDTTCPTLPTPFLCDSIDFNNDGLFPDDGDLVALLRVLAGGPCDDPDQPPANNTCNDIDFNNDGLFPDDMDLVSFLSVSAGGPCFE